MCDSHNTYKCENNPLNAVKAVYSPKLMDQPLLCCLRALKFQYVSSSAC